MEDDCSEFVVAISGDGTAICPGFQIGRVPSRPKALLVQLNNLVMVGRCRRDSTQYPRHKVTHWQVQTLNSLPDFGEPGIERNTVKRYRVTDMTREDQSFRRQRKNLPE